MSAIEPTNAVTAEHGRVIDGIVRVPGWTFQDVRAADPNPGPDEIYKEFTAAGDKFSVPNSWYFSEDFARREEEKLWSRSWVFACRKEKIPEIGSCYVHSFLDHSVLIVRTAEEEFKAFRNTCRHRGNQLRENGSCGVVTKFFCPFHGATYNLDGSAHRWPYRFDFPHLKDDDYGLEEVHLGEFKGFLFINVASDPIPFEEYIAPLPSLVGHLPLENYIPVAHVRKTLRCNWKLARQAFQEAIHLPVVHPQAKEITLAGGSQIDSPGRFIRRLISPVAVPSDQVNTIKSQKELLLAIAEALEIDNAADLLASLSDDIRARDILSAMAPQQILAETGVDVSKRATVEILDNLVYHIFPAFHCNVSASAPFCMTVIPGSSPDECLFDMIWFKESAPGADTPRHPERIDAGPDQTWVDVAPKETSGAVGPEILDQDTGNMEGQQHGLRASPDGRSIFANYGESMIISDMKTLAERLDL